MRLGVGRRSSIRRTKQLELAVATHEDPASASAARPHRPQRALDPRSSDAAGLPLRLDRPCPRELEGSAGRRDRPLPGEHLARIGGFLQPIGHVHRIARHERATLVGQPHDHLAGVDTDAHLEVAREEGLEPILHRQRRVQSPLGVILECDGCAENGHHRVSCELLDGSARQLDLLAHRGVETLELRADALGIAFAGVGGRSDEVGEENRDELSLLTSTHGLSLAEGEAPR